MPRKSARKWTNVPLVDVPDAVVPEVSETPAPREVASQLEAVRDELVALDARRRELLAERDRLVTAVRAAGAPWPVVEALAGASRPALVKRAPVAQAAAPWWFA